MYADVVDTITRSPDGIYITFREYEVDRDD